MVSVIASHAGRRFKVHLSRDALELVLHLLHSLRGSGGRQIALHTLDFVHELVNFAFEI